MKKITQLVRTKTFKKTSFFIGIALLILTILITLDPRSFLRFGYLGVFLFNLFGPGTLLIPMLSRFMNVPLLAATSALGMMFNDSVAWLVGNSGQAFIGKPGKLAKIEKSIEKFGLWALFFWSLIPTFAGKFVRFILMGYGFVNVINR